MERFLVLLSLLSFNAFAAVPGNAPVLTIGAPGQQTSALSVPLSSLSGSGINGIFSLFAYTGSSTGGNWYVLYKNGTAYATTSSTKAYCFNITASSGGGNSTFQLVSSQLAITNNTSTALTSPAYQGGASTNYPFLTGATANVPAAIPGTYVFGNSSNATYAAIQTGTATTNFQVHMDCYEL